MKHTGQIAVETAKHLILHKTMCVKFQGCIQIHILESNTNTTQPNTNKLLFKISIQIQLQIFNSNTNTLPFFIQIRFKHIAIFYLI